MADSFASPSRRGCAYWLRLTAFGLISFVVLGFVAYNIGWVMAVTRPAPSVPCCLTPADLGHPYEDVSFDAADSVTLRGWYIPGTSGAIMILVHGLGANRAQMVNRAHILAEAGYSVLLYDRHANGQSTGQWRTFGWADSRDVSYAVDYLLTQSGVEADRIGILGFSLGGGIALAATANDPRLTAVVAEEPGFIRASDIPPSPSLMEKYETFLYWLDLPGVTLRTREPMPTSLLERLPDVAPRPVFYLFSGPEDRISHRLVAYFHDHTPGPSTLWNVPDATHGTIQKLHPAEYEQQVISFFDNTLTNQ